MSSVDSQNECDRSTKRKSAMTLVGAEPKRERKSEMQLLLDSCSLIFDSSEEIIDKSMNLIEESSQKLNQMQKQSASELPHEAKASKNPQDKPTEKQ